jgi:hypothetical protein
MITRKYGNLFRCDHTGPQGQIYPTVIDIYRVRARQTMDKLVFGDEFIRRHNAIMGRLRKALGKLERLK